MKVRKKSFPPGRKLSRVEYRTVGVVTLRKLDDSDVSGKFVKYAPTLSEAERKTFDASVIEKGLKQRGAVEVVILPKFVADSSTKKIASDTLPEMNMRRYVDLYFSTPTAESEGAKKIVLACLDEEGL